MDKDIEHEPHDHDFDKLGPWVSNKEHKKAREYLKEKQRKYFNEMAKENVSQDMGQAPRQKGKKTK